MIMRNPSEYINEIFARMNVQQFREFVVYGQEDKHTDTKPYHTRLKENSDPIYNLLRSLNLDTAEHDKFANALSQALATHCAVYTEIGMKTGARLIHQLLILDDGGMTHEQ
jgi:hypothetical protein